MSMEAQPVLFESDEDCALLFAPEERSKRYTAQQAAELERLHTAVLMLLPSWPVEVIARQLRLSTRTVRALAAREAEKVAGFGKDFATMLLATGARWVALARTKEHEATFRDLNIGAGIVMDHARDLLLMGQVEAGTETKEVQDHAAAAEALRRMMADQAASVPGEPTGAGSIESQSIEMLMITEGTGATDATEAGGGPEETPPSPSSTPPNEAEGGQREGGGRGCRPGRRGRWVRTRWVLRQRGLREAWHGKK